MMLPSKELLSAVLGINIESHIVLSKDNRSIIYAEISPIGGSIISDINIYELMHMLKEWITKDSYYEMDIYYNKSDVTIEIIGECDENGEFGCLKYRSTDGIEFEAVTKACEWRLGQQK